jgi:hypothetical protein
MSPEDINSEPTPFLTKRGGDFVASRPVTQKRPQGRALPPGARGVIPRVSTNRLNVNEEDQIYCCYNCLPFLIFNISHKHLPVPTHTRSFGKEI